MRLMWKIFLIALLLSLVSSSISHSSIILSYRISGFSHGMIFLFSLLKNMLTFLISPVVLFVVFYFVGRELNLKRELIPVLVSLFLGCWLGNVISYYSIQSFLFMWYGDIFGGLLGVFFNLVWYPFTLAFSVNFFAGFTALSIAYLTKKAP